jgi:hypothetical protein
MADAKAQELAARVRDLMAQDAAAPGLAPEREAPGPTAAAPAEPPDAAHQRYLAFRQLGEEARAAAAQTARRLAALLAGDAGARRLLIEYEFQCLQEEIDAWRDASDRADAAWDEQLRAAAADAPAPAAGSVPAARPGPR